MQRDENFFNIKEYEETKSVPEKILTVFVTTYNRAQYLKECLESILLQSYPWFIVVVLDNASTDNTEEVIKQISDSRVKYIKHPVNIGSVANLNYAINTCTTKYFIIFHDDDIMEPTLLERELYELENNEEYDLIGASAKLINNEGNLISPLVHKYVCGERETYEGNEYIEAFLVGQNKLVTPSIMFRTSFMKEKQLRFNPDVGPSTDTFLWFEIGRQGGTICLLSDQLMKYRVHKSRETEEGFTVNMIKLLRHLKKDEYYNEFLLEHIKAVEKILILFVIRLGKRYSCSIINKDEYIKLINIIKNEFLLSKLRQKQVIFIKTLTILFPRLYGYSFSKIKSIVLHVNKYYRNRLR